MAAITPLTLTQLQDAIQVKYELNPDTPSASDDDYVTRTALINDWINRWEQVDGLLWNELWATATLTTVATSNTFTLPAAFKFAAGFVKFTLNGSDTFYKIINPQDVQVQSTSDEYAYITGKPGAFTLNINPTPTTASAIYGATPTLPYYKYATLLSSASDVTECPDPYFIVHGVAADLFSDSNLNRYQTLFAQAEARLDQMKIRNAMVAPFMDSGLQDTLYEVGSVGRFGE